jgi:type IV pilus assembly protein PilA
MMWHSICLVYCVRGSLSAYKHQTFAKGANIMMKKAQQGFTLIELMIVVAIVGILAALALPAYQDYTVRSKVSEGAARLAEAKVSVAEYYSSNSTFPQGAATAGFNTAAAGYVSTIGCASGGCSLIELTFGNKEPKLAGKTLALSGTATNGQVVWKCKAGTTGTPLESKYLPGSCR